MEADELLDHLLERHRAGAHELHLLGVLEQALHPGGEDGAGRVVAGDHQQEEEHQHLLVGEPLAVDLGLDEGRGQVVGRVRLALLDHRVDVGDELLQRPPDVAEVGDQARVLEGGRAVRPVDELARRPRAARRACRRSPSTARRRRRPGRGRGGRRGGSASARSQTRLMISRIRSVCSSARFGVKARWTSAFSRSWRGGSWVIIMFARDVDRIRRPGLRRELVDEDDAALRGEGLVVAADRGDVVEADDRPEAALVGEVAELAPVERLLGAQPLEDLVRRPVLPEVEVADVEVGEVGRGGECGH